MRQEIRFSTAVKVEKFEDDAERKIKRIGATVVRRSRVAQGDADRPRAAARSRRSARRRGSSSREILGTRVVFGKSPYKVERRLDRIRASSRSLDCDQSAQNLGRRGRPNCRRRTTTVVLVGRANAGKSHAVQSNQQRAGAPSCQRDSRHHARSQISRVRSTAIANLS